MYHTSIHSSVDGHLGCFYVLAIVNSAAMNNGMHVSFSILVPSSYMPRSGIAGSYGGFIPRKGKKEKKRKNRYAKLVVIDKEDLYTSHPLLPSSHVHKSIFYVCFSIATL